MPISFCEQNNFNPNPVFSFLKLLFCYWRSNGFLPTHLHPLKKTVFDSFFPCFPNTIMPLTSFNYISFRSVLCEHDYCDSALKAFMERAGDDSQSLWFIVLFFHLHSDDHCVQGGVMKVSRVLSVYGHSDWCHVVDSKVCVNNSAVTNVCSSSVQLT